MKQIKIFKKKKRIERNLNVWNNFELNPTWQNRTDTIKDDLTMGGQKKNKSKNDQNSFKRFLLIQYFSTKLN